MATGGRVRTSSALTRVAGKLSLSKLDVDEAIRDLYRAGLLQYQPDVRDLPVSGYITVVQEEVIRSQTEVEWERALDAAIFEPESKAALLGLSPKLSDLDIDEMGKLAIALKDLSGLGPDALDDAGFNVSARSIMGSSKVLSQLSQKMIQSLGLPLRLQNSSPRYVICAGPASPEATLLIENPRAFENAVRSGLAETIALVCTYGFGLSYLGQEWLQNEMTSEHDKPIPIVRSGNPPPLDQLFSMENIYLWADLDLAAFDIYLSLKRAIPQLRLSKIYEALVPMLNNKRTSHPYAALFDKSGQREGDRGGTANPNLSDDPAALTLLNLCKCRGADQEAVGEFDIMSLGMHPYSN